MSKLMLIFILGIFLINFVSASDLELSIEPKYYVQGHQVEYTPDITISAISFEIIGKNNLKDSRILNILVVDSYPKALKNVLPTNIETLRILQTKTLWTSGIIDINELNKNDNLWIAVEAVNEKTNENYYQEVHLNFSVIEEPMAPALFQKIGEKIWEGNYEGGLLVLVVGIIIILFAIWRFKVSDKMNTWREKAERKRLERKGKE